jgi:hypothetical protein
VASRVKPAAPAGGADKGKEPIQPHNQGRPSRSRRRFYRQHRSVADIRERLRNVCDIPNSRHSSTDAHRHRTERVCELAGTFVGWLYPGSPRDDGFWCPGAGSNHRDADFQSADRTGHLEPASTGVAGRISGKRWALHAVGRFKLLVLLPPRRGFEPLLPA